MNPYKLYKIAGILSIVFGLLSALCLMSLRTVPAAIMLSMAGFVFSTVNIFIDSKYMIHDRKYPLGYIGLILSSLPVLLFMYLIFWKK